MESRLILQNRIKEFSTIKNVFLKIGNIIGKNRISKDLGKVTECLIVGISSHISDICPEYFAQFDNALLWKYERLSHDG